MSYIRRYIINFHSRVTNKIVLRKRLSSKASLNYQSGDHVGIAAENRIELVNAILARLANKPASDDLPVQVQLLQEKHTPMGKISRTIILNILAYKKEMTTTHGMIYNLLKVYRSNGYLMRGSQRPAFVNFLLVILILRHLPGRIYFNIWCVAQKTLRSKNVWTHWQK